ncbi:hypothetical protein BB560_000847 [Smittium megazygosporum]|uniref:Beta'-coat protein n=1 Tax=Smittium megazygosporum TaxID=133381 RepID=A0A2T9ZJ72_9FUNG|nr:hypothetical protein BB560_000847 [Smittium megazygosporum]
MSQSSIINIRETDCLVYFQSPFPFFSLRKPDPDLNFNVLNAYPIKMPDIRRQILDVLNSQVTELSEKNEFYVIRDLIKEINFAFSVQKIFEQESHHFLEPTRSSLSKSQLVNPTFYQVECSFINKFEFFSALSNFHSSQEFAVFKPKIEIMMFHSSSFNFSESWKVEGEDALGSLSNFIMSKINPFSGGSKITLIFENLLHLPSNIKVYLKFCPTEDHQKLCRALGEKPIQDIRFCIRNIDFCVLDLIQTQSQNIHQQDEWKKYFNFYFLKYMSIDNPQILSIKFKCSQQIIDKWNKGNESKRGVKLDIKRKLLARTERIKCIDMHPSEPWILASLYNGKAYIWNYETQNQVKTFEICNFPVRAGRFVERKNWIVTGSDDLQIRVFNYNTHERVISFEAHQDYIRALAVHPSSPYLLSGSDDMSIKLWDWEKKWQCIRIFEGHQYFVMGISINPKDTNTFASASLDKTIKVWNLGSSTPNFTLQGHEKGVNVVDYYFGNEKPLLISGADDFTARIWDYQNNSCIRKLEGHSQNVIVSSFHPSIPIIYTAGEDGSLKIWNSNNYRLETTLNYGLGRIWTAAATAKDNLLAIGADEGLVVLSLGTDEAVISMDSNGRTIWAKQNEIFSTNVKNSNDAIVDGEMIPVVVKNLGNCEIYPQMLHHSPNGRFVVVCGDGEYIIYTALAWRNKSFGNGLEFAWAQNSTDYAVRDGSRSIKIYRQFKERPIEHTGNLSNLDYSVEQIFGGSLLSVRSTGDTFNLYDWETGKLVRRIDVAAQSVFWSESGDIFVVVTPESFYVLSFNINALSSGAQVGDEGIEDAVELITEISEPVVSGCWIGSCFIYTTSSNKLNYLVGDQTYTIAHLSSSMKLLGYISRDNRVYLSDKNMTIISYSLPLGVIEYQTAILRSDFDLATEILASIPLEVRPRLARFLEAEGHKQMALDITTDPEQQFDLAIQLGNIELASELAEQSAAEAKWRIVADLALSSYRFEIAETAMKKAKDYNSLLLLYTSSGNYSGIEELSIIAANSDIPRLEFTCYLLMQKPEKCIQILNRLEKFSDSAVFARAYLPDMISQSVDDWKKTLISQNKPKSAQALADPASYPNLFTSFDESLKAKAVSDQLNECKISSKEFSSYSGALKSNIIQELNSDNTLLSNFLKENKPSMEHEVEPEPESSEVDQL